MKVEFNQKLQALRKERGLTQEELAQAIFVSRTAVSKWESGRGYPNLDSLKELAAFFALSLDELIGPADILTLAEKDKQEAIRKYAARICGALDVLTGLLLFLPVFGLPSVPLYALSGQPSWERALFTALISLTVLDGLILLLTQEVGDEKRLLIRGGLLLSALGVAVFISARQPYAALLYFALLLAKGWLLYQAK